jgi:hypothetical protein
MSKVVVTEDFFTGEFKLSRQNFEEGPEEFQAFLDVEEENALRKLLGHTLYDLFAAATLTNEPWPSLVNGGYYTLNERQYKWKGLKAILVPYLYAVRVAQQYDELLNTGVEESNTENSTKISPVQRICRAQSKAYHAYGCYRNKVDTLYGYMQVYKEALFPTFQYDCNLRPQNIFGL